MRYILTAEQMKRSDHRMIRDVGIPSLVLMERAALQCVAAMKEEKVNLERPLIVCGSGNNGGDGFAIARLLAEDGYEVETAFVGRMESRSEETRTQMQILENLGITAGNSLPEKEYSVIIDAVFGIGLSRKVEGRYRDVIERMNRYQGYKVAVDISSGISADTGEVLGCAFRADLTVTFAYEKLGHLFYPGSSYAGKVLVRPIGIVNPDLDQDGEVCYTLDPEDVMRLIPKRTPDSNKGSYGKVLMITGSRGMSGAAYLSAKAAYRTGAGLVRIYTEESNRQILQQKIPEAVMMTWDSEKEDPFGELPKLLEWADVVCLGCGLGTGELSQELVKKVLQINRRPCIIDADGLNILAGLSEDEKNRLRDGSVQYVLTPHMKEMSRLTGEPVEDLKENRIPLLKEYVGDIRGVCAMKDSRTLVSAPGEKTFVNSSGNSAMAKAGAGDVLAGVTAGLMAQKMPGYQAAVLAVYLHGLAGDEARARLGEYSVLADDIADGIGSVLHVLEEKTR